MVSFFVACTSTETKTEIKKEVVKKKVVKKVWAPEDMNSSELALLMRAMWDSSMVIKEQIVSDEKVNTYADLFKTIHTAKSTNDKNNIEVFNSFANTYQQNMEAVDSAKTNIEKKRAFNTLVNTCVGCHQQYCQGPIPKIKKLYIRDEQRD